MSPEELELWSTVNCVCPLDVTADEAARSEPPSVVPPKELGLLVNRVCFFDETADEALQVLRDDPNKQTFLEIYAREEREWIAAAGLSRPLSFLRNAHGTRHFKRTCIYTTDPLDIVSL